MDLSRDAGAEGTVTLVTDTILCLTAALSADSTTTLSKGRDDATGAIVVGSPHGLRQVAVDSMVLW